MKNKAFKDFMLYRNRELEHESRWCKDHHLDDYHTDRILRDWLDKSSISIEDKWAVIKRLTGSYHSVARWIYRQLAKELDQYNINPYPSTNYLVIDKNDKETLGKINFAKRHCYGTLEFNLYPLGTFYGMKPKEYTHLIFNVETHYKYGF